jgi:hypothetical protein
MQLGTQIPWTTSSPGLSGLVLPFSWHHFWRWRGTWDSSTTPGLGAALPASTPTHLYFPAGTIAARPVQAQVPLGTTLTSTGLVWIGTFSLITQTIKPILLLRFRVMATLKLSLLLATLLLYKTRPLLIKLWRRLQGRRGRHLAWNCRGSGGSLSSSTMLHLSRLVQSTKP